MPHLNRYRKTTDLYH